MPSPSRKLKTITGFVAFIDLVGFSDLIGPENSIVSKGSIEILNKIIMGITNRIEYDKKEFPELSYIFISDTIIVWCETKFFSDLVWKICQIQNTILRRGMLTRGALTYGNIHVLVDANSNSRDAPTGINIFGAAYVQAYQLHDRAAKYPRIVLSDVAYKTAYTNKDNDDTLKYLVRKDRDGWYIVRQFGRQIFYRELNPKKRVNSWPKKSMNEIIEVIDSGCKKYRNDPHKREKWRWIKNHYQEDKALPARIEP